MNEGIKSKITKLFALAGNNPSQEEAQSALLNAQRLMTKYGLDDCDIDEDGKVEGVISQIIEDRATGWRLLLWINLGKHFPVQLLTSTIGGVKRLEVYGFRNSVETFCASAIYVVTAFEQLWHRYLKGRKKDGWKTTSTETKKLRNEYLMGFSEGLSEAFKKQETALMIVTDVPAEVTNYINQNIRIRKGRPIRLNRTDDEQARSAGYTDGSRLRSNKVLTDSTGT